MIIPDWLLFVSIIVLIGMLLILTAPSWDDDDD